MKMTKKSLLSYVAIVLVLILGVLALMQRIDIDKQEQAKLPTIAVVATGMNEEELKDGSSDNNHGLNYTFLSDDTIKSDYAVLLDVKRGRVIAGKDYDSKIYPASMTKVMTLIVAVEQLRDLDKEYTFSYELYNELYGMQASTAGFEAGETVKAKDLLYGLILPSGADCARAIAEMVAGTEDGFAKLMNEKCEALGLKKTHFTNASGLHSDNQFTTPLEMSIIMSYAMSNEKCKEVLTTKVYKTSSTNKHSDGFNIYSGTLTKINGDEVEGMSIIAGKTGYTEEAGHCLVTYAVKGDNPYIVVTAKTDDLWENIFDTIEIYKMVK